MSAPAPPSLVDAHALAPLDEADRPTAEAPLGRALEEIAEFFPAGRAFEPVGIEEHEKIEALTLYLEGHAARIEGNNARAIELLERAATIDPDSPAPWREIGWAHLSLNDRHAALVALRRAFDRDPTDIQVLEKLAFLIEGGTDERQSAAMLARLLELQEGADPALQYIVPAKLGHDLTSLGYLSAGAELLLRSVDLPDVFTASSNRAADLTSLYRRRGDTWGAIGDSMMRLGRPEEALAAYQSASRLQTLDPGALAQRRLYAAMRLGRPYLAASFLLDRLYERQGRTDELLLDGLGYISSNSDIRRRLDEAILSVSGSLDPAVQPLVSGHILLARAAIRPHDEAISLLRDHLAQHPADDAALADLFATLSESDPAEAMRETIALTEATPRHGARFTGALLTRGRSPAEALLSFAELSEEERNTPAAMLVNARLLIAASRLRLADEVLARLLVLQPDSHPAIIARTTTLTRLGRLDEADQLLVSIDPTGNPDLALAKAIALVERGESPTALVLIGDTLDTTPGSHPARVNLLLLGAKLSAASSQDTHAEAMLLEALELDPTREQAFSGLISLYSPNGALEDDAMLVEIVARLREANPASTTLRIIRAREAFARGQIETAERELLKVIDIDPTDRRANTMLVELWSRTDSLERAERWLTQQSRRFPSESVFQVQLAQVLILRGDHRRAARILDKWLEKNPGDLKVSALNESIHRRLGDDAYANFLRLRRLENSGDPSGTARGRVDLYIPMHKFGKARDAIELAIEHARARDIDITEAAAGWLMQTDVWTDRGVCEPELCIEIESMICDRIDGLPHQSHRRRLRTLGLAPDVGTPAMLKAARRAAEEHPDLEAEAITILVSGLRSNELLAVRRGSGAGRTTNAISRRAAEPHERVDRYKNSIALLKAASGPGQPADQRTEILAAMFITLLGAVRSDPPMLTQVEGADWLAEQLIDCEDRNSLVDRLAGLFLRTRSSPSAQQRAGIAIDIANTLEAAGRLDGFDSYYMLALDYTPSDPAINNNYGYRLLVRNVRLEEAAKMIEIAYEAQPNATHIVDSMGWARYKIGVIHSELDAEGNVIVEGAVSILRRAAALAQEGNDPEAAVNRSIITDHLGDALWASGEREPAIAHWKTAEAAALQALEEVASSRDQNRFFLPASTIDELRQTADSARTKIEAAQNDRRPPIAEMNAPANSPGIR